MAQAIIQSTKQDAYINQNDPYTNYGNTTALWVGKQSMCTVYRTLLQFGLFVFCGNVNIISAKLKLYMDYTPNPNISADITPYMITQSWDQNIVNWNNQPVYDAGIKGSTVRVRDIGWYEWDVTEIVSAWMNGSNANCGIVLKTSEGSSFEYKRAVSSEETRRDYISLRPILLIQYNILPISVRLEGRLFTDQKEIYTTQDIYQSTLGYDTSQQSLATFFIKNEGSEKAVVCLEISPDDRNYMADGIEVEVLPGKMVKMVPCIFAKYTRVLYKAALPTRFTHLAIYYQAHV